VGVEVDERHLAETVDSGHAEGIGPGDGVVATQDDGHLPRGTDLFDCVCDAPDRDLQLPGADIDVAHVDHSERLERVDPAGEMGSIAVHRPVIGVADGLRPESGTRPVGGAPVEGGTQDDHGAITQLIHGDRGDAQEGVAGGKGDVLGRSERNLALSLFVRRVHPVVTLTARSHR
jgi:hypothetical protein